MWTDCIVQPDNMTPIARTAASCGIRGIPGTNGEYGFADLLREEERQSFNARWIRIRACVCWRFRNGCLMRARSA